MDTLTCHPWSLFLKKERNVDKGLAVDLLFLRQQNEPNQEKLCATSPGALCNAAISACAAQQLWQRAVCLLSLARKAPPGAEFRQSLSDGGEGGRRDGGPSWRKFSSQRERTKVSAPLTRPSLNWPSVLKGMFSSVFFGTFSETTIHTYDRYDLLDSKSPKAGPGVLTPQSTVQRF